MPIFNVVEFILHFEFAQYIFCAFGFYGVSLCVQKLVLGGNRV